MRITVSNKTYFVYYASCFQTLDSRAKYRYEAVLRPIITLIFYFFGAISVQAADVGSCSTVRLDKGRGPLSGIPAIHQGNLKHCANITAALMMTAYLRENHPELKDALISPEKIWTQILASDKKDQERLLSATSGRTCNSIELLKSEGGCDRTEVRKILRSVAETNLHRKADREEVDFALDGLLNKLDVLLSKQKANEAEDHATHIRNAMIDLGIPEETIPERKSILDAQTGAALLNKVFDIACHKNGTWISANKFSVTSGELSCKRFDFVHAPDETKQKLQSEESFKAELHRLFDLQEVLPVGIAYCSGVLLKPKSEHIVNRVFPLDIDHLNGPRAKENLAPSCKFHASAVIGRERREDGKCYFLIQNSWGSSCSLYSSSNRCENGKVWVEENALARNLLRIVHLKK